MSKKITDVQIIAALKMSGGVVSSAANLLGCDRQTIYNRLKNSPKIEDALAESREVMLDKTENALMKKIEDGDTAAIIFMLKTRGKDRGYSERSQLEHSGQITITRTIVHRNESKP